MSDIPKLVAELRELVEGPVLLEREQEIVINAIQALEQMAENDARYRWLRDGTRATFDESRRDEPQLVFTKRSAPFISGYAQRVDAAIDAARKAEEV